MPSSETACSDARSSPPPFDATSVRETLDYLVSATAEQPEALLLSEHLLAARRAAIELESRRSSPVRLMPAFARWLPIWR